MVTYHVHLSTALAFLGTIITETSEFQLRFEYRKPLLRPVEDGDVAC